MKIKMSIKITINLANILDRNCPLRTLEMVFQSIKTSKFSGGAGLLNPLPFGTHVIN